MIPQSVWLILAEGFEEIEAVTPLDVLRRAGIPIEAIGLAGRKVKGAHGIVIEADRTLADAQGLPDAIILPGGLPGATNLKASAALRELLVKMAAAGKPIAAICASPAVVLGSTGLLDGRRATCYPGFEEQFGSKVQAVQDRVVIDGSFITSRGPGSAMEFALALVELFCGKEKSAGLTDGMLVRR